MADVSIEIALAYAKPTQQLLMQFSIPEGATVQQAIEQSGILQQCPEIDLTVNKVGIFSLSCDLEQVLQAGDRVEIYRALQWDPKDARRNRASKR